MVDVAVLGRIGYDLFAEEHGVALKDVGLFSRHLGGSSANIAVGLARLGLETSMIGCVGDDALGDFLIEYLQKEGVSTERVRRLQGVQSSLCLCETSPPDHFPQVFYRARAADTQLQIEEADLESISQARLFVTNGTSLCQSPSRESTLRAMEHAKQTGVQVAFDVDYREMSWNSSQEAALYCRLALPFIDLLLANRDELALVGGNSDRAQAIRSIVARGPSVVIAKLDSEGTLAATSQAAWSLPAFEVPVVSTIGAGDGFAAGFLLGQVKGMSLQESLRRGNASAAIVVSRLMCADAMPSEDELGSLLREQADLQPLPASLAGEGPGEGADEARAQGALGQEKG
ncbi:MAG TPA: 5-dehydro-2-deoxygluconokinase [Acidobacteriota bacterium]|nr:5-dehydro-2-deoxygluconokinase [Acidobacteriota bacterium]